MALNTSHTPDGNGVLIYNGEMILLFSKEVNLEFDKIPDPAFKGSKKGQLYLTSHRIIFKNKNGGDRMRSFCYPFHCLRDVKLEQPIFGANYLKGTVLAQPNGNWEGDTIFKLTFNQGGCIDFGQALLKAANLATRHNPVMVPPPYTPPAGGFFSPPPAYYTPATNTYNGFEAPINAFPDHAPASDVYMYEAPPPYGGIGPAPPPYPAGSTTGNYGWNQSVTQQNGQVAGVNRQSANYQQSANNQPSAPQLPTYEEAIRR